MDNKTLLRAMEKASERAAFDAALEATQEGLGQEEQDAAAEKASAAIRSFFLEMLTGDEAAADGGQGPAGPRSPAKALYFGDPTRRCGKDTASGPCVRPSAHRHGCMSQKVLNNKTANAARRKAQNL